MVSLVPRLIGEPVINFLRMCVISPRSGEYRILTAFYSFTGTSPVYDGWRFSRAWSWGIGVCLLAGRKASDEVEKGAVSRYKSNSQGKRCIFWLPTCYGKSAWFEQLLFHFDNKLGTIGSIRCSLVQVLSPLIAVMVNQVANLRKHGIKVVPVYQWNAFEKCSLLYSVAEAILGHTLYREYLNAWKFWMQ